MTTTVDPAAIEATLLAPLHAALTAGRTLIEVRDGTEVLLRVSPCWPGAWDIDVPGRVETVTGLPWVVMRAHALLQGQAELGRLRVYARARGGEVPAGPEEGAER